MNEVTVSGPKVRARWTDTIVLEVNTAGAIEIFSMADGKEVGGKGRTKKKAGEAGLSPTSNVQERYKALCVVRDEMDGFFGWTDTIPL